MFFANRRSLLRQKDILEYEALLKGTISSMLAVSTKGTLAIAQPEIAQAVALEAVSMLQDSVLKKLGSTLDATPQENVFMGNLIHLLSDLNLRHELVRLCYSLKVYRSNK